MPWDIPRERRGFLMSISQGICRKTFGLTSPIMYLHGDTLILFYATLVSRAIRRMPGKYREHHMRITLVIVDIPWASHGYPMGIP